MVTLHETWLIYLRKSRQDDPNETIEEVLAKHEVQLQEWAQREIGYRIPEENIYREVVSGESIEERVEIKKVLARIEDPAVQGVIVIEPQRLSRGDLEDCGRLINAFRFTKTQVCTPYMVYDLEKKMERKFFQDELLRGREFLEYTKEILLRGRVAAIKRGCYIGRLAPYGYDKVTIGKDHTLQPNDDADTVRLIFDLYVNEQLTHGQIAKRLNEMGIPAPRGDRWVKDTIRGMVKNEHYAGKVYFNKIKLTPVLENGEIVVKRLSSAPDDIIIAEGKHEAIIDPETWAKAQATFKNNPRLATDRTLKNPLAGVLRCSKCGKVMCIHPYKHSADRYECRTKPRCFKSVKVDEVQEAVMFALENAELPALQLKAKNDDGNARKIQRRLLEKLEKQMEDYRAQEERQYELLETNPNYSQEVFERRNAALRAKMEECQSAIYKAKSVMPENVDYEERVVAMENAIAALKDPTVPAPEKNKMLRSIVDRIEYTGEPSIDYRGRSGVGYRKKGVFTLEVFLKL